MIKYQLVWSILLEPVSITVSLVLPGEGGVVCSLQVGGHKSSRWIYTDCQARWPNMSYNGQC